MSISRRPSKGPVPPKTVPAKPRSAAVVRERPLPTLTIGGVGRPTDLSAVARTIAGLQERIAQRDAELERERRGRSEDADTIAEMLVRIVGLEKSLRETTERHDNSRTATARPPKKYDASIEELREELTTLTFERDTADRQREVARLQFHAAEAKLALVARQLEWAEDAANAVESALSLTSAPMRASIARLLERLAAARSALLTQQDLDEVPPSLRAAVVDAAADSRNDSARKRPSKRPR